VQTPVIRLETVDFEHQVLEKLGRLEAKMDMIVGDGQPGRMSLAEERIAVLEKNDLRRTIYDRIVVAAITFVLTAAISAMMAWRSYLGMK
jgi:hypothetical protein